MRYCPAVYMIREKLFNNLAIVRIMVWRIIDRKIYCLRLNDEI